MGRTSISSSHNPRQLVLENILTYTENISNYNILKAYKNYE